MIHITDKTNCCGCSACAQACPKQCISFDEDTQGFRYPLVNADLCIDCGLCEKICPCLNSNDKVKPLSVLAANNPNDEIRLKSSSGGIFTMLAEAVIEDGGVVFGARFDENWDVKHDYTESKDGLEAFRGSKYVQSRIGNTYTQAREFLKDERKVLFTGTSCQIAGLKKFLRKEYDSLITVEIVCHGVPSPLVWREYLKDITERPKGVAGKNTVLLSLKAKPVITGISFRDKRMGWKKYGFALDGSAPKADKNSVLPLYQTKYENAYLKGFLSNVFLRPSCYSCKFKQGASGADIALADFWGADKQHPYLYDDKGTSCVVNYTDKGQKVVEKLNMSSEVSTLSKFVGQNPAYNKSHAKPGNVIPFWKTFHSKGVAYAIKTKAKPTTKEMLRSKIIAFIGKLGLIGFIKKILK